MKCSACGHENPNKTKFCFECGAKLKETCPSCSADNPPQAKHCGECGAKLADAPEQASVRIPDLEHQFASMQDAMPAPILDQIMAPADGENRLVTVLFADMSSSVATTSGMEPDEAAELVNRLLKAMVGAFTRYEGRVDRFLGDGALAVFGTPYTHENDPERAILAAQEIREKAQDLGLQVTAGINTGRVYFGSMGSDEHRELTVVGPVVNLAARIQGKAEAGEILIGETTQRHVRRSFELTRREVEIKGIDGTVPVYRVEKQLPRMQKARGLEGVTAELIGRDEELARLIEAYELTASGEGQLACVIGEAGLGKTRLVAELRRHVEKAQKPPLWLEGRCVELDVSPSYWPFIDLFREYFGLSRQDEAGAPAQKLRGDLGSLAKRASFSESRVREIGCILGRLLSVTFGDEWDHALDGADSEVIRNMSFLAIRDLLIALAKEKPVMVVLDDLHWADGISIDMISLLMESLTLAPILFVCVYRPDRDHRCIQIPTVASRKCPERFAEIALKELTLGECRRMIQSLLSVGDLPSELRSMILEKSQGNPLFVEEVIRSLIDSGVIYLEDDEWKTSTEVAKVAVPETVQGIILSRVDRLDENLKHLLQSASVIGRIFGRRLLETITNREKELDENLGQLEDLALIYQEHAVPEQEYAFKHVLARDAVYEGIVKRMRTRFHTQIAEAIEKLYRDRLDEYFKPLAFHYERAGKIDRAIDMLRRAAMIALNGYATSEAESLVNHAFRLHDVASDDLTTASLLYLRGQARSHHGDTYGGSVDLKRAHYIYRANGNLTVALEISGSEFPDWTDHQAFFEEALQIAEPNTLEAARIIVNRSSSLLDELINAYDIARREGDIRLQTRILRRLSSLDRLSGRRNDAIRRLQHALKLSKDLGDFQQIVKVHGDLAICYSMSGEQDNSHFHTHAATEVAEKIGMLRELAENRWGIAVDMFWRGELRQAITTLESSSAAYPIAPVFAEQALFLFYFGQYRQAIDLARQAAKYLQENTTSSSRDRTLTLWSLSLLGVYWPNPELLSILQTVSDYVATSMISEHGTVNIAKMHIAIINGDVKAIEEGIEHCRSLGTEPDRYKNLYMALGLRALGAINESISHFEGMCIDMARLGEGVGPYYFWPMLMYAQSLMDRGTKTDVVTANEIIPKYKTIAKKADMTPLIERFEKLEKQLANQ